MIGLDRDLYISIQDDDTTNRLYSCLWLGFKHRQNHFTVRFFSSIQFVETASISISLLFHHNLII
jgi:hypothetical protein